MALPFAEGFARIAGGAWQQLWRTDLCRPRRPHAHCLLARDEREQPGLPQRIGEAARGAAGRTRASAMSSMSVDSARTISNSISIPRTSAALGSARTPRITSMRSLARTITSTTAFRSAESTTPTASTAARRSVRKFRHRQAASRWKRTASTTTAVSTWSGPISATTIRARRSTIATLPPTVCCRPFSWHRRRWLSRRRRSTRHLQFRPSP